MTELARHLRHAASDLYLANRSLEQAMVTATAAQKAEIKAALVKVREAEQTTLFALRACGNGG